MSAHDDEIIEQLEAVRADGRTNMLDMGEIQNGANDLGLHALVVWIEDATASEVMAALREMGRRSA